jgi:hypothetical protein
MSLMRETEPAANRRGTGLRVDFARSCGAVARRASLSRADAAC